MMAVVRRRPALSTVFVILLLAIAPSVRAQDTPLETPRASVVIPPPPFPADQIHPGLKGVARTVFEGDHLEEFEVEFLGILKNAIGPQQDMILARLHGPKVEFTGVVAGMSGSPVFVDGRLVGAISYRIGSFTKEPIAGITPIADMMRAGGPGAPGGPAGTVKVGAASNKPADLLAWLDRGGQGEPMPASASGAITPASAFGRLEPIATPLMCAGCDPGVLSHFAPVFEAFGLLPSAGGGATFGGASAVASGESTQATGPGAALPGGSGGASSSGGGRSAIPAAVPPLVAGGPIGAALATGDLNLSAVGTLTHIEGNRIYAFGHPMTGMGAVDVPMTRADVLLTLASSAGSFKIANSSEPVGSIVEDRLTAIVGEVGRPAATLPVDVKIKSGATARAFHYDVVRDRTFTPVIAALTAANSLVRINEYDAGGTVSMRARVVVEGHPEVTYEDLYSATSATQPVHLLAANDIGSLIGLVSNNPFEEAKVLSASAEIEILPPSQVANVTAVQASRSEVRPGETFRVSATLSPFRGADRTVNFDVTLPEDTPSGEVQILVGGGNAMEGLDRRVLERQTQQASNLDDLIRLVSRQRRSRTLYLRVMRRAPSAIVRSEVLPGLPLSVFSVLNNPRLSADSTLMLEAPIMETGKDLDVVASGGRRISLKVK
jgi:hypothetical protein